MEKDDARGMQLATLICSESELEKAGETLSKESRPSASEAGEALGWVGSVAGVEGFHAPSGHSEGHDEIGVSDLGVVCIRVDLYRAVACLAAGFVT